MAGQVGRHVGAGTGVAHCGLLCQLCGWKKSELVAEWAPTCSYRLDTILVPQLEESALLLHAIVRTRCVVGHMNFFTFTSCKSPWDLHFGEHAHLTSKKV